MSRHCVFKHSWRSDPKGENEDKQFHRRMLIVCVSSSPLSLLPSQAIFVVVVVLGLCLWGSFLLESSVTTSSSLQASTHHPARITVSQRESRTEQSRHSHLEEKTVKGKKKTKTKKQRRRKKLCDWRQTMQTHLHFFFLNDNTGWRKLLVWMLKPSLGRFYIKVFVCLFVF